MTTSTTIACSSKRFGSASVHVHRGAVKEAAFGAGDKGHQGGDVFRLTDAGSLVLAHEFAHIRRYDYLVNILQMVVETLLFYHPAVWWTSARIRHERELCCDDIAVAVDGWQIGHQYMLRPVSPPVAIGEPHTRQDWPARR